MGLINELKGEGKSIWVKYIDDFEIKIRYVGRSEMNAMLEKCKDYTWDKKNHTRIEKLDSDRFYRNFSKVIQDWRGLTVKTLSKMMLTKSTEVEREIPFSEENAHELLTSAYDFDEFIRQACMDLETFYQEKTEEEIKNSSSSQAG